MSRRTSRGRCWNLSRDPSRSRCRWTSRKTRRRASRRTSRRTSRSANRSENKSRDSGKVWRSSQIDVFPILPSSTAESCRSSYLPIEASPLPIAPATKSTLRPVNDLPAECLEAHFALGELCYIRNTNPIDVLWTWVNGSDVLLEEAKQVAQNDYDPEDPYRPVRSLTQARLYREHDELRHSMRSVLANFRAYTARFHLLTADFPIPTVYAEKHNITSPERWRLGQVPQWLDLQKETNTGGWRSGNVELTVLHHAEIFRPYNGTNFNSLAIESQLSHVDDISEYFIYMNDDLFMMNPMSPVSFYTPAYGIVLNLQSNLLVRPQRLTGRNQGEWRSLGESNYLLSTRFGARHRPYVAHEAKTASRALLHEMAEMWPDSFARTATHRFRETEEGDGDVNAMFMHSHFVVERAREALLWAWVVARIGQEDDAWSEAEAQRAWEEIGGVWGENDLLVKSGYRDTLDKDKVQQTLKASGYKAQSLTTYVFSSLDGYPYAGLGITGQPEWPSFTTDKDEGRLPRCRVTFNECFVVESWEGDSNRASEVFKNIAFRKSKCGDCIIMALVQASGRLGLSAFLPDPQRILPAVFGSLAATDSVPHLPLVEDWQVGNFSLRAVIPRTHDVTAREWSLQLMQRYRYVIGRWHSSAKLSVQLMLFNVFPFAGDTPSMFERVSSPRNAASVLKKVERARSNIGLLCINDDVARANQDAEVTRVLKLWLDTRWKRSAAWERR
ncbi:hypothetical protein WOLCODRAFT_98719 [Wolfiporia cocos MD-104 SS10]|uniref:Stealth protein CR3 conserved region 3 domain-containing protein n=1 Tax=Wolfiporia cocos (strain MD-104) TaxID=742152 RepID=A0A2H3JUE2_WOLCO|nr:hypothetical protein WOLCODRAFT_98719 [Wolfiporia cocos MD-104 SS10]